jgi:hypothetical protein
LAAFLLKIHQMPFTSSKNVPPFLPAKFNFVVGPNLTFLAKALLTFLAIFPSKSQLHLNSFSYAAPSMFKASVPVNLRSIEGGTKIDYSPQ